VTLTTVGYGDITPITFGGKMLAMVIMVLGVGTVALPAAMLAARFSDEIQTQRDEIEAKVAEAMDDGIVDPKERAAIEALGKELGLPVEHVDKLIDLQKTLHAQGMRCPHCGKRL
jgi:voltage-gated potassium channel